MSMAWPSKAWSKRRKEIKHLPSVNSAPYQIEAKKKMFVYSCLLINLTFKDTASTNINSVFAATNEYPRINIESHNDQLSRAQTRHHWHPCLVRGGAFFFKLHCCFSSVLIYNLYETHTICFSACVSDFPVFSPTFKTNLSMEIIHVMGIPTYTTSD